MQTALDAAGRRRAWMTVALVVILALALWFATRIPKTIAIFVIAAFIASAVYPVAEWLTKHRIPRLWAIAIVYAALVVTTIVLLVIIVPMTIDQVQILVQSSPALLHGMQGWLEGAQSTLRTHFPQAHIPPELLNVQQLGAQRLSELLTVTVTSIGTFAINIATGLFIAFSALILSFFFLLNPQRLAESFAGFFPPSKRATARKLSSEAAAVFGGYIAGQVIVSAITGIVIAVVTALLGFKFALLIGIISAIGYAIPIIGMLVAQLIALVLCAPQGPFMLVFVQAVMFGVARISDNVLVPKIMGGTVGVSPITVMFAVFAGGELFGLPGLILGIPAAAIAKLVWKYFLGPWLHGQIDAVDDGQPEPLAMMEAPVPAEPIVVTSPLSP
ncbi:MAG TPA: AI-2E family transporter [Candidatus Baltobacteraceae bacterium]|nr:AI-2E family transporter [Candidatus Baltobacteraceae bacterium]